VRPIRVKKRENLQGNAPHSTLRQNMKIHLVVQLIALFFINFIFPQAFLSAQEVEARKVYESDPLNTKEAIDFYLSHSDKLIIKKLEDLPQDLVWQDGSSTPTFSDPRAIRKSKGRMVVRMDPWPMSFRYYGVDRINGAPFWFQNGCSIPALETHPDGKTFVPGYAREWATSKDKKSLFLRLDPEAQFTKSWVKISRNSEFKGRMFEFPAEKLSAFNIFYGYFLLTSGLIFDPTLSNDIKEQLESLTYYSNDTIEIRTKKANLSPEYSAQWVTPTLPRH
jgi:microcin C transport system substrate-binding protein